MKGQTKAKDNEAVPTLVFRRTGWAKASDVEGKLWTEKKALHTTYTDREKELQAQLDRLTVELAAGASEAGIRDICSAWRARSSSSGSPTIVLAISSSTERTDIAAS